MNLFDLFESEHDAEHFRMLRTTGFFGAQGAGCIFLALDTKRFLVAHRSDAVEQPGTWGSWGGAIDPKEDPKVAAIREAEEEAGYHGPITMLPLYVFSAAKGAKVVFRYFNFLAIIETEFTPRLNWESQGYKWCEFGKWPRPLHFGLTAILNDAASIQKMKSAMSV